MKHSTVAINKMPPVYPVGTSLNVQAVSWTHYRIGYIVRIYDNDKLLIDCSNRIVGDYGYDVRDIGGLGQHNVSMRVITANGSIEITNTTYNVLGEYVPPPGPGTDIVFPLPDIAGTTLGIIVGFCIILGFCLAPLGIAVGTDTDFKDIPAFVYILFACLGLTLSVVLGYIDIWVPFFLIIILIILAFIMWLRTNITEE